MIAFRISKIIKDDKIFYKFMTDENSNKLYFMEEIIPNKEYEEVIDEELINWLIDNYCEELR
jgi:hypothetical protein